jgi:broad specificity phosphatase PhoE
MYFCTVFEIRHIKNILFKIQLFMKNVFILLCTLLAFASCKKDKAIVKSINGTTVTYTDGTTEAIAGMGDPSTTTYFIVRHADKGEGDNPALTPQGEERAKKLSNLLANVPIAKVSPTNTKRAAQTAEFVKVAKGCPSESYTPEVIEPFLTYNINENKGKCILIVGHTNTIPTVLKLLTGKSDYADLPETEYDNLYIVTVKDKGNAQVMEVKY